MSAQQSNEWRVTLSALADECLARRDEVPACRGNRDPRWILCGSSDKDRSHVCPECSRHAALTHAARLLKGEVQAATPGAR